jgi:hypothetical protein
VKDSVVTVIVVGVPPLSEGEKVTVDYRNKDYPGTVSGYTLISEDEDAYAFSITLEKLPANQIMPYSQLDVALPERRLYRMLVESW